MDVGSASTALALVGTAGLLFWFIMISGIYRYRNDPFFAGGDLEAVQIRANLAATATSLAGALFFFMNNTAAFGWVMIAVPFLNVFGILLFVYLVRNFGPDPNKTGSVFRFLFYAYKSEKLAQIANLIVIFNFVAVFIIEILIGSTIFNYFFDQQYVLISIAAVLGLVSFTYVMRGGFDAVTQTDRWQFWLVVVGFSITLVTLFAAAPSGEITRDAILDIFSDPKLSTKFQLAFLVNAIFINLFLPATQVSTWERFSAGSKEESTKGFWQGAVIYILPVWSLAIGTAAIALVITSGQSVGFFGLFDLIRSLGPAASLIVFPFLFTGLVAALLSTADSFMISSMLAVRDFTKFKNVLPTDESANIDLDVKVDKSIMWKTGICLIISALIVTTIVSYSPNINQTVTQLLFAAYGMPCLLFPMVAYGCRKNQNVQELNLRPIVGGVSFGLTVLWGGAIYGLLTGDFLGTLLGPVFGIGCAAVGLWWACGWPIPFLRHAHVN